MEKEYNIINEPLSIMKLYLGALTVRYMAMKPNIILGIQTPRTGGREELVEKVTENFIMISKRAHIPIPNTRCQPSPPRSLREARLTPIRVIINTLNAPDVRR